MGYWIKGLLEALVLTLIDRKSSFPCKNFYIEHT
jgi:hypothetical protein